LLQNNKIVVGAFIVIILAFGYGVLHLFLLRFESGDVYAPYSSLRSDPLGTRALHESLVQLNISPVSRNYRPVSQLQFDTHTTLLYLGTRVFYPKAVSEEFADAVDRLTDTGGRLVIAFLPVDKTSGTCLPCDNDQGDDNQSTDETDQKQDKTPDQAASGEPAAADSDTENESDKKEPEAEEETSEKSDSQSPYPSTVSLEDIWGVSFNYDNADKAPDLAIAEGASGSKALPNSISWHSVLYFNNLQEPWKIIYRHNGQPVIIERPYKRGSILLCADSYLFSNEALWSERHPGLLARLIGPNSFIVFDEAHLGVHEVQGIAGLIRSFGFHWFFIGIIVLFILFIWKNSLHFVPPLDIATDDPYLNAGSGRDYAQGLISLLRRNIPAKAVLQVGQEEWKKSFGAHQPKPSKTRQGKFSMSDMDEIVSKNQSDPVKGYNAIRKIISEGKLK
jgi:hypothetical protein